MGASACSHRLTIRASARSVLAPPLLACLLDFAHVPNWSYLPQRPELQGRMLRHQLYSMIHVPRLKHAKAAELLLGFRIGTVGRRDFPVLPIQGQRGFRTLKCFSTSRIPV